MSNDMRRALELTRAPGNAVAHRDLVVGDFNMAEIEGFNFHLEFKEVPPKKTQAFSNARSRQLIDTDTGMVTIEIRLWDALESLIDQDMLVGGELPCQKELGKLDSFTLDAGKPYERKRDCARYLKWNIVQAIVAIAMQFYGSESEVAEDLGNSPSPSDTTGATEPQPS